MDIKTIFSLLRHLTSKTNTKDLTLALTELLVANFSGVQMVVYELQGGRDEKHRGSSIVGLDCLMIKCPINLHEHEKLIQAYEQKEEVHWSENGKSRHIAIPVVLYDTSVSHLVVINHPYNEGTGLDLLLGLLHIFTDIFRNIHEKGYDPLTRILNRQAFDQVVTKLAYASKSKNPLSQYDRSFNAIAILDIDNFKQINDQFGHAIGDETLVMFSQIVRANLRQEDLFFRYGGEEFVVLVNEVDASQTLSVFERCRQTVEARRFPQVENVTVSIGIATLDPEEHPNDSLSKADKALYFAKENGRNQVHTYEELLAMKLLEPVEIQRGSADFW